MKKKIMLTTIIIIAALIAAHFFASRTLLFKEEVVIHKNIDDVWEVLGNQFTEPHIWATNFLTSKPDGSPKIKGLTYLHRATTTESGDNWQELDTFEPNNFSLSYHISKGIPPIAKKGIGTWKLTKINERETRLNVNFILETKGLPGLVMSPIVSKKVSQASKEIVEEFKFYVENGQPHPRKIAAIKK